LEPFDIDWRQCGAPRARLDVKFAVGEEMK
jgi:hypothetical protein